MSSRVEAGSRRETYGVGTKDGDAGLDREQMEQLSLAAGAGLGMLSRRTANSTLADAATPESCFIKGPWGRLCLTAMEFEIGTDPVDGTCLTNLVA